MHDDWGHERDTFFSEKMMEELVYEPTKRIVQHVNPRAPFLSCIPAAILPASCLTS
jgi:hypothetical protein